MIELAEYVFGPVPSRRLGRSLGVDLVPFKTCTYDCIYCQLGRTTQKTVTLQEFFPVTDVLAAVRNRLSTAPKPVYITLSGSGEPTLYSRIEEVIVGIKQLTNIPLAVLTNGSLFWQSEVRRALLQADLVIPSLDAGDADLFAYVNRPHPSLSFRQVTEGLIAFGKEYRGVMCLEVVLLAGVTAIESEVRKLAQWIEQINPDNVQLNTVTRPPAEDFALPVTPEQKSRLAGYIGGHVEVISPCRDMSSDGSFQARCDEVLAMLKCRPCTLEDLVAGLGIHHNDALKYVQELLAAGKIGVKKQGGIAYYVWMKTDKRGVKECLSTTTSV